MEQGNFTKLAKDYINRPGYSHIVLSNLAAYVGANTNSHIKDVGAGTGKLTENLLELGFTNITAVEPNDAMREEGSHLFESLGVIWQKGSAEETGLKTNSADWLLMGSSFHWTNPKKSLPEFKRVLKPGRFITLLWNPRDLEKNSLQREIDNMIQQMVPSLKRVSSGSEKYTKNIAETLVSTGDFKDVIFVEANHQVKMSKERYIGAWRSVNDIQAQSSPDVFKNIILTIEDMVKNLSEVIVSYKTRSWTAEVIS